MKHADHPQPSAQYSDISDFVLDYVSRFNRFLIVKTDIRGSEKHIVKHGMKTFFIKNYNLTKIMLKIEKRLVAI